MAGRLPTRNGNQNKQVARRDSQPGDSLMTWLKSESIQGRIAEVASKALDPVRFTRLCNVMVYKTPKLQECDRTTILQCVIEAAAMGWELGFDAHLVPYRNKGRYECQLIADYRGLKKAVMRGGKVVKMKAGVVFEGEEYTLEEGGETESFSYKPKLDLDGNEPMLFAWARAWFSDGSTQFTVVRRFEVLRAMASSRGSDSEYSPWKKFPDRMWAKTALRRLCNEIGLSDEAMAIVRSDDERSFDFGGPSKSEETKYTVVDNTPDPEDEEDEAERQDASEELAENDAPADDIKQEDPPPASKKKASSKKSGAPDIITSIEEKAEKWGLTKATLVAAAESIEQGSLDSGLKGAKKATLEKMLKLVESEKGAYTLEEHALSWQDSHGGDGE